MTPTVSNKNFKKKCICVEIYIEYNCRGQSNNFNQSYNCNFLRYDSCIKIHCQYILKDLCDGWSASEFQYVAECSSEVDDPIDLICR